MDALPRKHIAICVDVSCIETRRSGWQWNRSTAYVSPAGDPKEHASFVHAYLTCWRILAPSDADLTHSTIRRLEDMAFEPFSEKDGLKQQRSPSGPGRTAIVLCQHVLLWSTLYIAASAIYTLAVGAVSAVDVPSTVLLLVAVSQSSHQAIRPQANTSPFSECHIPLLPHAAQHLCASPE
jgi:hypothetical protein